METYKRSGSTMGCLLDRRNGHRGHALQDETLSKNQPLPGDVQPFPKKQHVHPFEGPP